MEEAAATAAVAAGAREAATKPRPIGVLLPWCQNWDKTRALKMYKA